MRRTAERGSIEWYKCGGEEEAGERAGKHA